MSYTVTLIKKEEVAEGTMAFSFSKPTGYTYKAGQAIDITLINPPETDSEGNTRTFSLTSAPHEDVLSIATRMRDTAFKRVLKNMEPGTELSILDASGSMTLHNDISKPAVILAGGIGITPFYSIIKDATQRNVPHKIFLFYSNRRPEDAAFLSQLEQLQTQNQNFKLIATMTDMGQSSQTWGGERGYITKEMVQNNVPEVALSVGYLAGPMNMVAAMRKLLNEAGLNDDYIRSEEFTGY